MGLSAFDDGGIIIATDVRRAAGSILFALACCLLLIWFAASQYIVARLINENLGSDQDTLLRAEKYLPTSAPLQARLAVVMTLNNLSEAESHAGLAINLSRYNYKYRLILASIKERQGDVRAAEQASRQATALAPYNTTARLRLARLLGDQGRINEATAEFRRATLMDHSSLPATLEFIWRISKGDVHAAEAATNDDVRAQLILANFFLDQSHGSDAARVFGQIKDRALLDSSEGATFLNNLMTAGHIKLAHDLWLRLVGSDGSPVIWNGSFEEDPFKNFTQFDWIIESSDYARIAIDPNTAHTGSRSLRLDFRGRDTTTLNNEIRQLLLLQPGAKYKFQGYAKTEGLITPQGPRVVITSIQASNWLAVSAPIAPGTNDWQPINVDFLVPQAGSAEVYPVLISIKRTPEFSYDDPTRGTVWFDDFTFARTEAGK